MSVLVGTQMDFGVDGTPYAVGGTGRGGGLPIFSIVTMPLGRAPFGYVNLSVNNGALPRSAYPGAYNRLVELQQQGDSNIGSIAGWNAYFAANGGRCGMFAVDTVSETFMIPCLPGIMGLVDTGSVNGSIVVNGQPYTWGTAAGTTWYFYGMGATYYMKLYDIIPDATAASIESKLDANSQATCRAWGFIGAAAEVFDQYGVLSVTRLAAGSYKVTLASPAPIAHYPVVVSGMDATLMTFARSTLNRTTTTFQIDGISVNGSQIDTGFQFAVYY